MNSSTTHPSSAERGITTLAFRSKNLSQTEQELLRAAQRRQVYLLLAIPTIFVSGFLLRQSSLGVILPLLVFISLITVGIGTLFAAKHWRFILIVLPIYLIVGVLVASVASHLFISRTLTATLLGIAFLILLVWQGSMPLRFFRQWRLTDPRIQDSVRTAGFLPTTKPSWLLAIAFVLVVVLVPLRHSISLAILTVILLSLGTILWVARRHPDGWKRGVRAILADGRFMHHLFLAYPDHRTTQPGEWTPKESQGKRRLWSAILNGLLTMTLVVGLSFCCPWEAVGSVTLGRGLWAIPPATERSLDWVFKPLGPLLPREGGAFFPMETGRVQYVWALVFAIILIFTLPLLTMLAIYAPALLKQRLAFDTARDPTADQSTDWEVFVHRLRNSEQEATDAETGETLRESDHLFMGVFRESGAPVLLHKNILDEHMYIAGQTGSGKTSLGIIPLLIQLIRSGGERPCPIVILDLKGDSSLFNTAVEECQRRRVSGKPAPQKCLYFRTDRSYSSNYFNPFRDFNATTEPHRPIEIAEYFVQALSLFHGDFYGASYYSKQHRDVLLSAIIDAREKKTEINNFDDLYKAVTRYAAQAGDRGRDAVELLATIHAVAQYEQLGDAPASVESIFMPDLIKEGQLAYFWLPSQLTGMSVREIGKLALYSLLTTMQEYRQSESSNGDGRRGYLIIDEFQRIAAENMQVILQQARSFGISVILANQDPSDLRLPNVDLRSTVYTNTRVKQFFSLTDPKEIEMLEKLSGEEAEWLSMESQTSDAGWPFAAQTTTMGRKQAFRPRFKADTARLATNAPNDSVLLISRGRGYTQLDGLPHVITTPWPTTQSEYERRRQTPWPRAEARVGTAANKSSPDDSEIRAKAQAETFQDRLRELVNKQEKSGPLGGGRTGSAEPPKPKGGRRKNKRSGSQEDSSDGST